MIPATNPVKVDFLQGLPLFRLCPPPPILQHIRHHRGVIPTSHPELIINTIRFYVWLWNHIQPVGVVNTLQELPEVYHQLFQLSGELLLRDLLALQQRDLI